MSFEYHALSDFYHRSTKIILRPFPQKEDVFNLSLSLKLVFTVS